MQVKQKAKRYYYKLKTSEAKKEFNLASRQYRKTVNHQKTLYRHEMNKKLRNLKTKDPKAYWRTIKNEKGPESQKLSLETFVSFFKKLNSDTSHTDHMLGKELSGAHISHDSSILDLEITEKEIIECIDQLKSSKSPGIDDIINEYLKTTKEVHLPHYLKIFNLILNTGLIPSKWSLGVIIPIHKKGEVTNPDNYRGITLLSCFGKLFTSVLNNRLYRFLEKNNLLTEMQAGFRKFYCRASLQSEMPH